VGLKLYTEVHACVNLSSKPVLFNIYIETLDAVAFGWGHAHSEQQYENNDFLIILYKTILNKSKVILSRFQHLDQRMLLSCHSTARAEHYRCEWKASYLRCDSSDVIIADPVVVIVSIQVSFRIVPHNIPLCFNAYLCGMGNIVTHDLSIRLRSGQPPAYL
jgi:hypothetical protein